ncbi:efflux RND transporter periplasmic adaptor subunit [Pseudoruegeria sp. SHC-113]|uniref:efflux RND transporter periplasmic adaptor subunit n=1 Tax=Pseudoruegeria sp. SHC-113 TaxID=2855439 RepID=UPI0021BB9CB7|nr:HlyD family efflux transporter periplasmic adaptor subunit [Pseudoruegeria sp. SHC-113]MCT8158918.1 HlyD family efflux transporter periplasmic adaptor subunit [Pseudoruegeria sp. SHC-113]
MRFLGRSLMGLFLLAVTLGLFAWAGNTVYSALEAKRAEERRERPSRERVFAAGVMDVVPGAETPVLETFGEVRSRRTLDIRAASSGRVVEMAEGFEEGGRVQAGDFLLRIDPADAEATLDRARADLSEAQAEVRDAERGLELASDELSSSEQQFELRTAALERQQSLKERGVGTDSAVETAALAEAAARQQVVSRRQALAQAEARADLSLTRLNRAEITVAEAERKLADTEITAGFTGLLGEVAVVEGGLVANNERLATLTDPDALEVAFRVSTADYARLLDADGRLIGAPVQVRLDVLGLDLTATGTISRESAAVGEGQTGRLLFARLDRPAGFRPGDFVTVAIEEPELRGVARVPSTALNAASQVLVIGEEDRLEEANVELLRRQGDEVLIRAPQIYGREIVTERSPVLGAGIKVRPIRPEGTEAPEEPELVTLTDERRAKLVAFVEGNARMPAEVKQRILSQLEAPQVPAQVLERLESRMGG